MPSGSWSFFWMASPPAAACFWRSTQRRRDEAKSRRASEVDFIVSLMRRSSGFSIQLASPSARSYRFTSSSLFGEAIHQVEKVHMLSLELIRHRRPALFPPRADSPGSPSGRRARPRPVPHAPVPIPGPSADSTHNEPQIRPAKVPSPPAEREHRYGPVCGTHTSPAGACRENAPPPAQFLGAVPPRAASPAFSPCRMSSLSPATAAWSALRSALVKSSFFPFE